jgi:long-chain acyl-CoA synthetase
MIKAAAAETCMAAHGALPVGKLPEGWPVMSIAAANAGLTGPGARFEMEEVLIRGVKTRVWKNAQPTLRDSFLASRVFAERAFLVYEADRVTYATFDLAVRALAAEFHQQGIRKGDRVALIMRNLPEWPVAFFAAAVCGAIVTPLNAWWTGAELEYGLKDSGARVAIVDTERWQRIRERASGCPELKLVYLARGGEAVPAQDERCIPLERVIGRVADWPNLSPPELPAVDLQPEDLATIFYTSGTTGRPKGALGTHRNINTNVLTAAAVLSRAYLRRGEPIPDPATAVQRVSLLAVPFFHVTGCNATLITSFALGGKIVLMRKWDTELALQLIERERVTVAGGVPTIVWQLIEHPKRTQYDLSSLELVGYGGAPSAPDLVRRILEVFPGSRPGNGWGMTETAASFSGINSEDYVNRPDSCGPPPAVGEMKIMSADGARELATGETGELWVRGPMVVQGYWNNPEATAATFVNGWLRTGDVARLDAEGFCYIVDRAKDMLIRGGENIYCIEVENVLYDHPAVIDAALLGIPHKTLGEEPAAVVQLQVNAEVTEDELRAWVAARLAAFKVPVRILFLSQPLPRNPAGKILKGELKPLLMAPVG